MNAVLAADRRTVALQFSQRTRRLDRVDPKQFRISYAIAYAEEDGRSVEYLDPAYESGTEEEPLAVTGIEVVDESSARLHLSAAIPLELCEGPKDVDPSDPGFERSGLFLHYASSRNPVLSERGNRMQDFGADFARARSARIVEAEGKGTAHRLDLLVPVHCAADEHEPAPTTTPARMCTSTSFDRSPPRLREVRFSGETTLELRFSEKISADSGVDPRQFRLSLGTRYAYEDDVIHYFYDPNEYSGESEGPPLEFVEARPGRDDHHLELVLSSPLNPELCADLRELKRELVLERLATALRADAQMGLFLHYTREGAAPVRDRSGNALEDIGAHWALRSGAVGSYMMGTNRDDDLLGELVEVRCPRPARR